MVDRGGTSRERARPIVVFSGRGVLLGLLMIGLCFGMARLFMNVDNWRAPGVIIAGLAAGTYFSALLLLLVPARGRIVEGTRTEIRILDASFREPRRYRRLTGDLSDIKLIVTTRRGSTFISPTSSRPQGLEDLDLEPVVPRAASSWHERSWTVLEFVGAAGSISAAYPTISINKDIEERFRAWQASTLSEPD